MNLELLNMRELNHRITDGIRVRLLWSKVDGRVTVSVVDGRTGAAFAVDVHENESALDVFHHPYAYAAHHGIETSVVSHAEDASELPLAA